MYFINKKTKIRYQKGGKISYKDGIWIGHNNTGKADAEFFNYLGLDNFVDYWNLWTYPFMSDNDKMPSERHDLEVPFQYTFTRNWPQSGIMNSIQWNDGNKEEILRMLNNIINKRSQEIENFTARGKRDDFVDSEAETEGHTRVLALVLTLRNLIMESGTTDFHHQERLWEWPYDIRTTQSYIGSKSEIGHLNPTQYNPLGGDKNRKRKSSNRKSSNRKRKSSNRK